MFKLKVFLLLLFSAGAAYGQFATITDTGITDASGNVLASGTECFTPANNNRLNIPANYPGGTISKASVCSPVIAGTMTPIRLVKSNVTQPVNLCYVRTVVDNSNHAFIIGPGDGFSCLQITGDTNLNTVAPNAPPGVPVAVAGAQGIQGAPGADAYHVWLQNGHSGSYGTYLASLMGQQGPTGPAMNFTDSIHPPVSTDQYSLSVRGISPTAHGAKCDASVNPANNSVTGTDDTAAFLTTMGLMVAYGIPILEIPPSKGCLLTLPSDGTALWQQMFPGLVIEGNHSTLYIQGGPTDGVTMSSVFQWGFPKTATGASVSTNTDGTLTATYAPMPMATVTWNGVAARRTEFVVGKPIKVTGTSTAMDTTYSTVTSITDVTVNGVAMKQLTASGAANGVQSNLSASNATLHEPETNGDYDGVQDADIYDLTIDYIGASRGQQGMVSCYLSSSLYCSYLAGLAAFRDYRGGGIRLHHSGSLSGVARMFDGVSDSDFSIMDNAFSNGGEEGLHFGPNSNQVEVHSGVFFEDNFAIDIDGVPGFTQTGRTTMYTGSPNGCHIKIANRQWNITGAGGGGLSSTAIRFEGWLEHGSSFGASVTAPSFICLDSTPDAVTQTLDLLVENPLIVNSNLGTASNIPRLIDFGKSTDGADSVNTSVTIFAPPANQQFQQWVRVNGTHALNIAMMSTDPANNAIPLCSFTGAGSCNTFDLAHTAQFKNNLLLVGSPSGSNESRVRFYSGPLMTAGQYADLYHDYGQMRFFNTFGQWQFQRAADENHGVCLSEDSGTYQQGCMWWDGASAYGTGINFHSQRGYSFKMDNADGSLGFHIKDGNGNDTHIFGSDGSFKLPHIKSLTGTRFLCTDAAGNVTAQVSPCSGT
jgi:hypothetical protein